MNLLFCPIKLKLAAIFSPNKKYSKGFLRKSLKHTHIILAFFVFVSNTYAQSVSTNFNLTDQILLKMQTETAIKKSNKDQRLDSVRTLTHYGLSDRLTLKYLFYNSEDLLISDTSYVYNISSECQLFKRISHNYDDKLRITQTTQESMTEDYNSSDGKTILGIEQMIYYKYNDTKLINKRSRSYSMVGDTNYYWEETYDYWYKDNRLDLYVYYIGSDTAVHKYYYKDTLGKTIINETYFMPGISRNAISDTSKWMNRSRDIIETDTINQKISILHQEQKLRYSYDSLFNIAIIQKKYTNEGVLREELLWNWISDVHLSVNPSNIGKWQLAMQTINTIDEFNNITKQVKTFWDARSEEWTEHETSFYYYNYNTTPTYSRAVENLSIYPIPANSYLIIQNDLKDQEEYLIYDSAGQLAKQGKILGNKLDIQELENGLYILQVRSKKKTLLSKFIKY